MNILQGVTKCAKCGAAYTYAKRAKPVLACAASWKGSTCDNSSLNYKIVEEAVLKSLFEDDNIQAILSPSNASGDAERAVIETKVKTLQNEVQALQQQVKKVRQRGDLVPVSLSIQLSEYEIALQKEELKLSDVEIKYTKNDFKQLRLNWEDIHKSEDVLKRARMQQFISRYVDKVVITSSTRKFKIINVFVDNYTTLVTVNIKPKVGYQMTVTPFVVDGSEGRVLTSDERKALS